MRMQNVRDIEEDTEVVHPKAPVFVALDSRAPVADFEPGSPRGRKPTRAEICLTTPERSPRGAAIVTPPPRSKRNAGYEESEVQPVGVEDYGGDAQGVVGTCPPADNVASTPHKIEPKSEKAAYENDEPVRVPDEPVRVPQGKMSTSTPVTPTRDARTTPCPKKPERSKTPSGSLTVDRLGEDPDSTRKDKSASTPRNIEAETEKEADKSKDTNSTRHHKLPSTSLKVDPKSEKASEKSDEPVKVPDEPVKESQETMPAPAPVTRRRRGVRTRGRSKMPAKPVENKSGKKAENGDEPARVPDEPVVDPQETMPAPVPVMRTRRSARVAGRSRAPAKPKTLSKGLTANSLGQDPDVTSVKPRKDKSLSLFSPSPAACQPADNVTSTPRKIEPKSEEEADKGAEPVRIPDEPVVDPPEEMPARAPATPSKRGARTPRHSKTPAKPKTPSGGLTADRLGEDPDSTSLTPRKDKSQRPNRLLDMTPTKRARSRARFPSPVKDRVAVPPSVSRVYGLVQKATGSVGGNGSDGAIYGELTVGCMQKVVNILKEETGFDENSSFIDVGSGLGKPNFHVAQDPGCEISYGLELEEIRWKLSVVNHRRVLLDRGLDGVDIKKHNLFFSHGDILSAKTFDPFTHVYMFDIGFPPSTLHQIAKIFNASKARHLISYQKPHKVMDEYGFEVDKILQLPLSLTVSHEGHMMYLYRRKEVPAGLPTARISEVDPMFATGVRLCREGGDGSELTGYVEDRFREHTSGGVRTRGAARRAAMA